MTDNEIIAVFTDTIRQCEELGLPTLRMACFAVIARIRELSVANAAIEKAKGERLLERLQNSVSTIQRGDMTMARVSEIEAVIRCEFGLEDKT